MDWYRRFSFGGALIACALAAEPAAAQTCVDPPAGLRGWWTGDGDSLDVQSGLHAVAVNGATYAPGLVGEAFRLDGMGGGQNDRIDLPPSALGGLTDVSVEMWVQTTDANAAIFSAANSDAGANELLLYQGAGGMEQVVKNASSRALPFHVNDGAWHHVAFVRSGTMAMLYVDGVRMDARALGAAGPLVVGPGGLLLGQEQDCLGGCFDPPTQAMDGLVDEVSIYDRALADDEIAMLHAAGAAGKCKPTSTDDLLAEIGYLETQVSDLEAEIEGLNGDLASRDAEVAALLAAIGSHEGTIGGLELQIAGLIERIGELEAQEPPVCEEPPACEPPPTCDEPDDDHGWPHYWKYKQLKHDFWKYLQSKHKNNHGNHWDHDHDRDHDRDRDRDRDHDRDRDRDRDWDWDRYRN